MTICAEWPEPALIRVFKFTRRLPVAHGIDRRKVSTPFESWFTKMTVLCNWRRATISRETHDKLRRAQDLPRHAIPDA
jgi:hypothetical protein